MAGLAGKGFRLWKLDAFCRNSMRVRFWLMQGEWNADDADWTDFRG